jgi:hypothetical protein
MCVVLLCEFRFSFPVRGLRCLVFLRFFHLWLAAAFAMAITMDINVALITALYVVLIQAFANCHRSYGLHDDIVMDGWLSGASLLDSHDCALVISTATLFDYRLSAGLICFDDELRYWVKRRSITWFSQFLRSLYEDSHKIEFFRMDKATVANMYYRLQDYIQKRDTHYRLVVPVEVRVCTALYKLAQGENILSCSENFAIGKSTVNVVIREVVGALNNVFGDLICWPRGNKMRHVMVDFRA